jgi:tRNA isopentenyl-2-thiomethyl-A-37 hydroxylase MiaE
MSMLRLKLPTDPRWVNIVETNIEEILTDHAWCEQKAASNAITIITINIGISGFGNGYAGPGKRRNRAF